MDRKILIIVENLPVPFDTRVWQEATTLAENGYVVSVICPKGKGYDKEYEYLKGVHIYRHNLPTEGNGALGYAREYWTALREETRLAKKIYKERGFHVIHGCNPPDDIYMVAKKFKKYGVDYVFDHHDICPELFEAKFGKKSGLLYRSQLWLERNTYKHCTFAFVTNESYKKTILTNCANKVVFGDGDPNDNAWWESEFGQKREWTWGQGCMSGPVSIPGYARIL